MNDALTLSHDELVTLTGYHRAHEMVEELHRLGFLRARIDRLGRVVLERAHYLAVCTGAFTAGGKADDNARPRVNKVR
jgi:hypothetical protein